MSCWRRLVLGLVAVALGVGTLGAGAEAAAPYCGQVWGSLPKEVGQGPGGMLITNVRAGRHACFDRLVIDLAGSPTGYRVSSVPAVLQQGSGEPLSLRGGAFLDVTVFATTFDLDGSPSFNPPSRTNVVDVSGFRTLRQVADGGSFEGHTTFGVGVRARLPFRVFILAGPGAGARIVIDVGHRW
jgi:hypothetical protein